jgi:hypothetical protein
MRFDTGCVDSAGYMNRSFRTTAPVPSTFVEGKARVRTTGLLTRGNDDDDDGSRTKGDQ